MPFMALTVIGDIMCDNGEVIDLADAQCLGVIPVFKEEAAARERFPDCQIVPISVDLPDDSGEEE